jgi:hypothetical protein
MKERLLLLDLNSPKGLFLMSHEYLADAEIIFNLSKECQQG